MMTISDIIEIIVVCALIFFPLGYLARHSLRRIRDTLRLCQGSIEMSVIQLN
ncbi:cellulose biosynthesis protein BcsF [Escherichia coli]